MLRENYGISRVTHWTGRDNLRGEPSSVALVIIITGFASHKVSAKAKAIAKKNKAKIIYLNKGLSRLAEAV